MAKDFVLEIGTEEIPARFMESALQQLVGLADGMLAELRLESEKIVSYGTPRRLTLYLSGLAESQKETTEEVRGPAKKAAFDEAGEPTKAVAGFARSQGVAVTDLIVKEAGNTEYIYAVKTHTGRPAMEVLPDFCLQLINKLSFPKPQRWGYKEMRFARPIRWLLALFGSETVEIHLEGLTSGNFTFGHRFLSQGRIIIAKAPEYVDMLKKHYVIVDQLERRQMIWDQVQRLAAKEGGQVAPDEELLEEVTYLLEYPTALCGTFAGEYLRLPKEVLITPMREHQRYFPILDADGKLLAKFITVRNGTDAYLDTVREGNEKVLRARLADAEFFYQEDLKLPLTKNVEKLRKIVFQESLGTVYEKVERLISLGEYLTEFAGAADEQTRSDIRRTAYLCKADLISNMVYEFPELQGIMGREYAVSNGEPAAVAVGIFEHYLPRFAGDILPASPVGRVVSIADKIDTIVGCFAVGIQPTGSQDPYALRRQALGICHIVLDSQLNLSLKQLVTRAYDNYAGKIAAKLSSDEVSAEVGEFFKQRLKNIFTDRGLSYDVIDAVLAAGYDNFVDTLSRAEALAALKNQEIFDKLLTAYNRVANLAQKAVGDQVAPDLLTEDVEKNLFREFTVAREEFQTYLQQGQYRQLLQRFALLQQPIDAFFEGVMVMVEDERVKNNRLAMLKQIAALLDPVADLTKIVAK